MSDLADATVPGLAYTCRSYGSHHYQRVGIWEFDSSAQQASAGGHWIIYLHGGAWRDPRTLLDAFVPTLRCLMSEGRVGRSSVRGFASIDYRLSPHPQFPQDPDNTPAAEFREARHPDHLQDTRSALAFLAEHYGLTSDYTLIGHSVGATLAYQLLMGSDALMGAELQEVPLPAAIITISGIYDMVGLVQRLGEPYNSFTTTALGTDKEIWKELSPAFYAGNYKRNWPEGRCNIIAWSRDDTLIDEPEIDAMIPKLSRDGLVTTVRKDLTKQHNAIWEDGTQIAHLIIDALSQLHQ